MKTWSRITGLARITFGLMALKAGAASLFVLWTHVQHLYQTGGGMARQRYGSPNPISHRFSYRIPEAGWRPRLPWRPTCSRGGRTWRDLIGSGLFAVGLRSVVHQATWFIPIPPGSASFLPSSSNREVDCCRMPRRFLSPSSSGSTHLPAGCFVFMRLAVDFHRSNDTAAFHQASDLSSSRSFSAGMNLPEVEFTILRLYRERNYHLQTTG